MLLLISGPIYKYYSAYFFLFHRQSWTSKKDYKEATTEPFATANVVIDGNEKGGMSTLSYGICGKEGLFIIIPKCYLMNDLSTFIPLYGTPGIVVIC